jgi:putative nucleotidyltransferase with HDIG domain
MSMSSNSILNRVPPFPAALGRILQVCSSDDPSIYEMARAVATEEVLAIRVVHAANAATLAPVHAVTTVESAVSRLGASALRAMATAHYLSASLGMAFTATGLDRVAMWRHNLAAAAASAGAVGTGSSREDAYFAGLIHDIGKFVLAADLGHKYGDCVLEAASTETELTVVEARMLGVTHAEIGAEAARTWNFAPTVVEAIRCHHDLLGAGTVGPVASSVMIGNQVANELGFASTAYRMPAAPTAVTGMVMGIGAGIMSRARWALTNEVPRIEAVLTALS